jgi:hypothetical protein
MWSFVVVVCSSVAGTGDEAPRLENNGYML